MNCGDLSKKFIYPKDYESLGLCSHAAEYINKSDYELMKAAYEYLRGEIVQYQDSDWYENVHALATAESIIKGCELLTNDG